MGKTVGSRSVAAAVAATRQRRAAGTRHMREVCVHSFVSFQPSGLRGRSRKRMGLRQRNARIPSAPLSAAPRDPP